MEMITVHATVAVYHFVSIHRQSHPIHHYYITHQPNQQSSRAASLLRSRTSNKQSPFGFEMSNRIGLQSHHSSGPFTLCSLCVCPSHSIPLISVPIPPHDPPTEVVEHYLIHNHMPYAHAVRPFHFGLPFVITAHYPVAPRAYPLPMWYHISCAIIPFDIMIGWMHIQS